jgi:hypothetical protein
MPDDSDAEFERRYPQKPAGMPLWAILLIVFGAVGFFGCLGVVGLGMFGMLFGATTVAPACPPPVARLGEPPQLQQVFMRVEFERTVQGKTVAEVKAAIGEPPLSGGWDGEETWTYRGRTTNPATGLTDEVAEVVFRGGKVSRVNYRDEAQPGGPAPPPGK